MELGSHDGLAIVRLTHSNWRAIDVPYLHSDLHRNKTKRHHDSKKHADTISFPKGTRRLIRRVTLIRKRTKAIQQRSSIAAALDACTRRRQPHLNELDTLQPKRLTLEENKLCSKVKHQCNRKCTNHDRRLADDLRMCLRMKQCGPSCLTRGGDTPSFDPTSRDRGLAANMSASAFCRRHGCNVSFLYLPHLARAFLASVYFVARTYCVCSCVCELRYIWKMAKVFEFAEGLPCFTALAQEQSLT